MTHPDTAEVERVAGLPTSMEEIHRQALWRNRHRIPRTRRTHLEGAKP